MDNTDRHRHFLEKTRYFIPNRTAGLSQSERDLLVRYGHWLEALANGVLTPNTTAQKHCIRAAAGDVEPESQFEVAWVTFRPPAAHRPRRQVVEPDDFEDVGSYGEEGSSERT